MRSPAAERSLRRLVARLAMAEPDDVRQVLDALEPAQQAEVRALLDAYAAPSVVSLTPPQPATPPPAPEPAPPPAEVMDVTGLSPWLAARVAGDPGRMTPGARQALAEVVRTLPAEPGFALEAAPSRRGFNLFRRRGAKSWA